MRRQLAVSGLLLLLSNAGAVNYYPDFHSVEDTWLELQTLNQQNPAITRLDTCGFTQRYNLPIVRFIVSKNAGVDEDEPAALFNGVTHAREPLGNEICLYAINWILANYPGDARARRYVDSMELHFIPIVNTDGWKYNTENQSLWRKNQRDNNVDGGLFDPTYDGVDLARNFDWHWSRVGTGTPGNTDYYGPSAASESEVQAVMGVALNHKPVVGISYHSYGLYVYYPYYYSGNGMTTQDNATVVEMAQGITSAIGGYLVPRAIEGAGQSTPWLYGCAGVLDFNIETGIWFIPRADSILLESTRNFNGLMYLLDRCFYSGVTGHVRDSMTLAPLAAVVEILDQTGDSIVPRASDSLYGRYYRLLRNGTYRMRFSKTGYVPKTIAGITTVSSSLTNLEVLLAPLASAAGPLAQTGKRSGAAGPALSGGRLVFNADAGNSIYQVLIYSANGRMVRRITAGSEATFVWNGTNDRGRQLRSGIYFYRVDYSNKTISGKVILTK